MPLYPEPDPVAPAVSIVVIVYNDAERLRNAVASALGQTLPDIELIIVDDHSMDHTPQVVAELERADPRVRGFRLPRNSGGCSAPRNVGTDHANGTYVMYLDSDDTLDRNACRNFVDVLDETGADVASGVCVREETTTGHRSEWYRWLYNSTRVIDDVDTEPDLIFDSLTTNKCYRRSFFQRTGLRFLEGMHYEDLVFSASAYALADRVVLIPQPVYNWLIYPNTIRHTITNQRDTLQNFSDRLLANQMVDDVLISHGLRVMARKRRAKFVKHDLRLYLNDFPHRDAAFRKEILRLAGEHLAAFDEDVFDELDTLQGLVVRRVIARDLSDVESVVDFWQRQQKLTSPLVLREDKALWRDPRPGEDPQQFDVTALGLQDLSFWRLHLGHVACSVEAVGSQLTIEGYTVPVLGRIDRNARWEFSVSQRGGRPTCRAPMTAVTHGDVIRWSGTLDLADLHLRGLNDLIWDAHVVITQDDSVNRSPITVGDADLSDLRIPQRPLLGPLAGDTLVGYGTKFGNLAFKLEGIDPRAEAVRASLRAVTGNRALRRDLARVSRVSQRTRHSIRGSLASPRTKSLVARAVRIAPRRRRTVVFESHLGRGYGDNPKYISEALRRLDVDGLWRIVWATRGGSRSGIPDGIEVVARESLQYYIELARAHVWVDNQGFPRTVEKPKGTTYLQTWHGTPLKRMGFDQPSVKRMNEAQQQKILESSARWDLFLLRSDFDRHTLLEPFRSSARGLPLGYPRNDVLVNLTEETQRAFRRDLGLPDGRRIALYAPTFRETQKGGRAKFELRLTPDLVSTLLPDTTLLVRTHYLDTVSLPPGSEDVVRNVSGLADVTPLLAVADVLITDYSSVMFDYALTGRPMVFFAYDWDEYVGAERGTYFDLRTEGPGRLVTTAEEALVAAATPQEWATALTLKYQAFNARYSAFETGRAAEATVQAVFFANEQGQNI